MSVAYVDSSCILAVAFEEPTARRVERRLAQFSHLVSSNLTEAEVRAALRRELGTSRGFTRGRIHWADSPTVLSVHIGTVLDAGYVRGADCWHLATALYLAPRPSELTFLTLDERQRSVAALLGFSV